MILQVQNLSVTRGAKPIVQGATFSVRPGQVLGLVGQSGSGKSILLSAIMGLLPDGFERSGDIKLGDTDVSALGEAAYCSVRGQHIGQVFQEPMTALNPLMTIEAQVAEAIRCHNPKAPAHQIASETLQAVGLDPRVVPFSRYPHALSGGQRQRVATAIALACDPALLLADEPTTALDVITQKGILTLLKQQMDAKKRAMIFVTHDLALVRQIADHVAVMQAGEVVEMGSVEEITNRPKHAYTRQLLSAGKSLPSRTKYQPVQPVLEARNICVDYGATRAVDAASLSIGAGECAALIGPSGCGKSSLGRALLALEPLADGDVVVDGSQFSQPEVSPTQHQRRAIQIVFQDPFSSFNPRKRIRQVLSEVYCLRDDVPTEDALVQALERVGLPASALDRYPHQFSGGERQRIAIARALIPEPQVLVLDEAVSALDAQVRTDILQLLAGLQASQGIAYLFITHDLGLLDGFADSVHVMESGRIVESGPLEDVLNKPHTRYTKALMAASPHWGMP